MPGTKGLSKLIMNLHYLNPFISDVKLAEMCGCSQMNIWQYKKNHIDQWNLIYQEIFKDALKDAVKQLLALVNAGEWNSIKYVLDNTGYKQPEQVEVDANVTADIEINIE